jgi:D-alanyl-lipoteichoic acid acyltransferase DltB (MBOAT superfamily)
VLFPTIRFAIFFAVVLPTSWLLLPHPRRWRAFMVAASFAFYAGWNDRYVLLLAGSILGNWLFGQRIHVAEGEARRRWLIAAVAGNLGVLAWYKYAGFTADSASTALGWLGIDAHIPVPNLLLPVGISFFTFQALSYVIDVYRRQIEPSPLLDFAVYLSFFPHLVAGPIVRARELLPQLQAKRDPRRVDATLALWLIAAGLFKKVVIASYLAETADGLFAFPHQHGGVEALVGVYAYALQIYADFSGYTDMAIGIALLLGFRFPANFDAPYSATSLQDFWRRWHMTLSRWLRDYLYIPLGGGHGGRGRTYRNLMLTMVLGGLWHGAAWTFVVWGALHGGGLAFERWLQERREARVPATVGASVDSTPDNSEAPDASVAIGEERAPRYEISGAVITLNPSLWLRRIVVFHVVCLAWVFFRASSVPDAFQVLGRIAFHSSTLPINGWVVVVIAGMLLAQLVPVSAVRRAQAAVSHWSFRAQVSALAGVVLAVDVLGPTGVAPFIYFQF